MMKKFYRENKYLSLFLLFGLISALILCGIRAVMEFRNTDVCIIMSTSDMAMIDGELEGVRAFDGGNILDGALLLVEDENQYSNNPIEGNYLPDALGPNRELRQVRCFYLYPQFAARYHYLGYPGAEEIENILYRAVTDRNIRVLWLTPFVDAETGETITDAAVYNGVLENLSVRLARQGLTLGDSFSLFREYDSLTGIALFIAFGISAAGVILLGSLWGLSPRRRKILIYVFGPPFIVLALIDIWGGYNLFVPIAAFAASVIFPCLALWYMTVNLSAVKQGRLSRELGEYARILFATFGIAAVGGLFVGGLQSSTDYLLAIENFRGVKLSQILPVGFAIYVVLKYLCPPREILAGKKFILILGALILIAGVGYYILRTGNSNVGVLEQRLRNWLEHVLIARPRTKEFLVAWPCIAVSFVLVARGKKQYAWPFAILTSAGFASVVNTFCHSRSPLWLSLTRVLTGVIIGAAIGFAIICIMHKKPADGEPRI
jgi:hypothetical protein